MTAVTEGDGVTVPRETCHMLGSTYAGIAAGREQTAAEDDWLRRARLHRPYDPVIGRDGITNVDAIRSWRDRRFLAALYSGEPGPVLCLWSIGLRPRTWGKWTQLVEARSATIAPWSEGVACVDIHCPTHADAVVRLHLPEELMATPAARRESAARLTRLLACALHDRTGDAEPWFDVLCPHRHRVRITPDALADPNPASRAESPPSRQL